MIRKKIIAGNWKMHKTAQQAREFVEAFLPLVADHKRDEIVLCPTFLALATVVHATKGSNVMVGAQNMHWEVQGAYTGECSPAMLVAEGVTHVIIGHSERRQYFNETDDTVNRKVEVALEHGLTPIMCVGEVLEEREAHLTEDVLRRQCSLGFRGISAKKAAKLVVAYEPVWAIGTGRTATPEIAEEAHLVIRHEAEKAFGHDFAQALRIQYGGSVKHDNAKALMSQPDIDGALVGGASLDPVNFAKLVKY